MVVACLCHVLSLQNMANYRKRADAGDGEAQYWLGKALHQGLGGVTKDEKDGFRWLHAAPTSSIIRASAGPVDRLAGRICESNRMLCACPSLQRRIADTSQTTVEQLRDSVLPRFERKDVDEGVVWIRKAAEQGITNAILGLAVCMVEGIGIAQDAALALEWCRKLPEASSLTASELRNWHSTALFNLALYYDVGMNDLSAALGWYERAARAGNLQAYVFLIEHKVLICILRRFILDHSQGIEYYRARALSGDPEAQFVLSVCLRTGAPGVTTDEKKAVEWTEKAAAQGFPLAQMDLGLSLLFGPGTVLTQNRAAALAHLRKAAETGSAIAQLALGTCLVVDEKDRKEAGEWIRKAAEQGHAVAQEAYSCFLLEEIKAGDIESNKHAIVWLRKAARQRRRLAQYLLGLLSSLTPEKDTSPEDKAIAWLLRAYERGYREAAVSIGNMLMASLHVDKDEAAAVAWFRKEAEQGLPEAQERLARCFALGYGVERDVDAALEWYRKAANQLPFGVLPTGAVVAGDRTAC